MSNGPALLAPPEGGTVEETIIALVQWLRLVVEATGAAVIFLGVLAALRSLAPWSKANGQDSFGHARLTLARYLALALEFQLGADVLSTAIAPSWDQIGKLGAIAIIRTALNYFLHREMRAER